ncbi:hypothetical protein ACLK1T_06655 [Escherichia coli]
MHTGSTTLPDFAGMSGRFTPPNCTATAATITRGSGLVICITGSQAGLINPSPPRLFKDNAARFKILFLANLHYSRFVPFKPDF